MLAVDLRMRARRTEEKCSIDCTPLFDRCFFLFGKRGVREYEISVLPIDSREFLKEYFEHDVFDMLVIKTYIILSRQEN